MTKKEYLQINKAFVLRKVHSISFLIPVRRNSITSEAIYLNGTASLIFELCSHAKSPEELAVFVAKQLIDIDEQSAIEKLIPYIHSYLKQGLLQTGAH